MYSEDKSKGGLVCTGQRSQNTGLATEFDWLLQQLRFVLLDKRQHHLIGDA